MKHVTPPALHNIRESRQYKRDLRDLRETETTGGREDGQRDRWAGEPARRRVVNTHADAQQLGIAHSKPLIAAIAHELWKLHGGNEVLNWLEAEIILQNALSQDESQRHKRTIERDNGANRFRNA